MVLGLLTLNLVSLFGLIVTFAYGYLAESSAAAFRSHFLYGMVATLLAIFSQTMTIFYFLGTGKQIKELCLEHQLDIDLVRRALHFRSKALPALAVAMLVLMAAAILGGGARTRAVPLAVHSALAYLAMAANFVAFFKSSRYLVANAILIDEIIQLIEKR